MDHEQEIDTSDAGASSSSSIDTPSSLEPAVNAEQPQESATQSTGQDQAAQAVEPPQAEAVSSPPPALPKWPQKTKRKKRRWFRIVITLVLLLLILCGVATAF